MELELVARFHIRAGEGERALAALTEVAAASRAEAGCLDFRIVRALRDPSQVFIHSRWRDEAAFDAHARFPHTLKFLDVMEALVDQPPEIVRAETIWPPFG